MKSFFKSFFAALLALIVAGGFAFLLFFGLVAALGSSGKPTVPGKAVLVFDENAGRRTIAACFGAVARYDLLHVIDRQRST